MLEKFKANFNPVMFVTTAAAIIAVGIVQAVFLNSKIKPLAKLAKATKGDK